MSWVKIDAGFPEHPKVYRLGSLAPDGIALFVAAVCYSGRHLTDGLIPRIVVPRLVLGLKRPYSIAERLVAVNLWELVDEETYRIHDYLGYNPSRKQMLNMNDQRRAAGHNGGIASGEARREASRFDPPKQVASTDAKHVEQITAVTTRKVTPLSAREGLPHLDDAAIAVLEDVTGRSISLAGDRQLTEYDRLVEEYGLPKVRAALEAAARQTGGSPTARQAVWTAMKILEPMPSPKAMAQRERENEADRQTRAGFERTRRDLDANPLYHQLLEEERRRRESA